MSYKKYFFKSALNFNRTLLANFQFQIEKQNNLLHIIKRSLPERLSEHALSCVISETKVILFTDSAIWSSQLRFYHQAILQALQSSNLGFFESLKIKVLPETIPIKKIIDKKIIPSNENIDSILNLANNQSEGELKNALLRLGNRFHKNSKKD